MTTGDWLFILNHYKRYLEKEGVTLLGFPFTMRFPTKDLAHAHLLSMIPQMENFLLREQKEKFFRWLGFVQGVLWVLGDFTIQELREHNTFSDE